MRTLKLGLIFISLALTSAALAFGAPQRAFPGDPVEEKFPEESCVYNGTMPDDSEPVDEEAEAGESTEEPDFSLHTGDQPKDEPKEEKAEDAEEDVEPEKDEWFDEDVVVGTKTTTSRSARVMTRSSSAAEMTRPTAVLVTTSSSEALATTTSSGATATTECSETAGTTT